MRPRPGFKPREEANMPREGEKYAPRQKPIYCIKFGDKI